MYPILLRLGSFEVRTYGVFLFLAFLFALLYVSREAKRAGIAPKRIQDLAFYIILASIIGSRLLFVIYHWEETYARDPSRVLAFWEGGLVFYGGLLLAVPVALWYIRKNRLPLWQIADWSAPVFALGLGIARWGCFFNGCCFGKPTDLPWGVVFPQDSWGGPSPLLGLPLHPTQIYESIAALDLALLLLLLKNKKPFAGFLFWLFLALASLIRFFLDFLRYYEPNLYLLGGRLEVNQLIALFLFFSSLFMLLYLGRRKTVAIP